MEKFAFPFFTEFVNVATELHKYGVIAVPLMQS